MHLKEALRLLVPVIGIAFGLFLRASRNSKYIQLKKYWLLFFLVGMMLFFIGDINICF
jgi:hypothetical protein